MTLRTQKLGPEAAQSTGDCNGVEEGGVCTTWANGGWNEGYQAGFVKGVIASGYDGFGPRSIAAAAASAEDEE